MDGIIALGHFCETHGPCVILCTQRTNAEPELHPHSLTVPWCEACQSLELQQALVSREKNICYVTTRTPLQQDLAFLLKQATVRSLSCEEAASKDDGTVYFGDHERGHVLSHTFVVQDSLARGFHRKYSVLVLMKDKVQLLNCWTMLTKNIKKIATEIQEHATKINTMEQSQYPQRAVRQLQSSPTTPARSLAQLTGKPTIFAHIHMWFTWLLNCEVFVEKPQNIPNIPINMYLHQLRQYSKEMPEEVFHTLCYCILSGIRVEADNLILNTFKQLLPSHFELPKTGQACKLTYCDSKWEIEWNGVVPSKVPSLQNLVEKALKGDMIDDVLEPHIASLIMQWFRISNVVSQVPNPKVFMLLSLGVQKNDFPLLSYWTTQCRNRTLPKE